MDIIVAWLVQEDFEVTHNRIGSLPALSNTTWFGDLDPALTGCANTVVDVYAKGELSCV